MKFVIVLTTVGADFNARELATTLVELRLAACVNIVPAVQSIYRWEGSVTEDGEQLLIIKTAEDRIASLREELMRQHPYSVPEFVVLRIAETSDSYGAWLLESLS
jgi:periplasmic divalent cation tolerance protein